jgi:hypothetical protein
MFRRGYPVFVTMPDININKRRKLIAQFDAPSYPWREFDHVGNDESHVTMLAVRIGRIRIKYPIVESGCGTPGPTDQNI